MRVNGYKEADADAVRPRREEKRIRVEDLVYVLIISDRENAC
jgi:hypothetical protein